MASEDEALKHLKASSMERAQYQTSMEITKVIDEKEGFCFSYFYALGGIMKPILFDNKNEEIGLFI